MRETTEGRTLALSGALDVRRTAEVRTALYDLLARTVEGDVYLDLTEVESLDLTMLKVLAVAHRVAEGQGRAVVLRHCPPPVRRLLHLSHLRRMIPVEATPPVRGGGDPTVLPEQHAV